MLHFCFYTSRARSAFPGLVDFDILREAWAHNRQAGIGGYLLRTGHSYFQWLEGPAAQVVALMDRIAQDGRHSEVRILSDGALPRREFPNWVMGYHELTGAERESLGDPATGADTVLRLIRDQAQLRIA